MMNTKNIHKRSADPHRASAPFGTCRHFASSSRPGASTALKVAATACLLVALPAFADDTLGTRMRSASNDIGTGFGYAAETVSYILATVAGLAGLWMIWQASKNPNGPHSFGKGALGLLLGAAFLVLPTLLGSSSQTIAGNGPQVTGAEKQMQFDQ